MIEDYLSCNVILKYVAPEIKYDRNFLTDIIKINGYILRNTSKKLQKDKDILKIVNRKEV